MSNKKKLKSRDGATRITPDKSVGYFCGMYKLQAYDKKAGQWSDIEGCALLTWTEATNHSPEKLRSTTPSVQSDKRREPTY